jgi:hypothetical protein
MSLDEPLAVTLIVARAFEKLGITYAWRDVLGVIKVQAGALDAEYLRRWAPHLGVADLLERALSEA